jgi:rfaE bifunctional protein kinase chain/domain
MGAGRGARLRAEGMRPAVASTLKLHAIRGPRPSQLVRWADRMRRIGVVVWGDFMLDEYWRCRSLRVSREAPVLVLEYESRIVQLGGAANAARNLAALGARVAAVGWIGADRAGGELRAGLERAGVDTHGLLEHAHAETVVKTRIVAGDTHTPRQQVVRVDHGAGFALTPKMRVALQGALRLSTRGARAVLLSDYGYDSVTPTLAAPWIRSWRAHRVTVGLDTRYRLARYRGVSIATPNEGEAAAAAGVVVGDERDLVRAASRLRRILRTPHLVITRGRDGLTLWDQQRGVSLAAWGGEEAVDVTGAGDAVVATATLALAAGAPALVAAALANVAGSVAVSRRGAVAVSHRDLADALGRDVRGGR